MQHGVDRRLEQGEVPKPRHPTGQEDLLNLLHLMECAPGAGQVEVSDLTG